MFIKEPLKKYAKIPPIWKKNKNKQRKQLTSYFGGLGFVFLLKIFIFRKAAKIVRALVFDRGSFKTRPVNCVNFSLSFTHF